MTDDRISPSAEGDRDRAVPAAGPEPLDASEPAARAMAPADAQPSEAAQERALALVDGDWHRLHPATPLLRGGLAVIITAAIVFNSLRDRIIGLLIPQELDYDGEGGDVIAAAEHLAASGTLVWVLLGLLAVLLACIGGFWLAWRVHRFRVTGDVVEVRQGLLFRTHRRAPLARIQGVNVEKPWFARLFGACKLEIQSAGADANVELAYLSNDLADALRYEILARSAGRSSQRREQQGGSHAQRVVDDFLRPDAELAGIEATSLVRLRLRTVILSSLLDLGLVLGVLLSAAAIVAMLALDIPWLLFTLVPTVLSIVSITMRTLSHKLRYSIARTPDGIRLAYGLLSTTTEVLPPGRVFSIAVTQPLLWRPMGWWKITFTRATKTTDASSGQQKAYANMLLPVGSRDDVETVIGLVLPGLRASALLDAGLVGSGAAAGEDGFVTTPRRARILRPLSWRRNGVAFAPDAVLLRKGRVWRSLGVVPLARTQSFAMHQGPLEGALGVAHVAVHVVGAALSPSIGALGVQDARAVFERAREVVPAAIGADTTETWHVRTTDADADAMAAESPPGDRGGTAAVPASSTVDGFDHQRAEGMEQHDVTQRPRQDAPVEGAASSSAEPPDERRS